MPKKIPLRQCLGCREMKPKRELIRAVQVSGGGGLPGFQGPEARPGGLCVPRSGVPEKGPEGPGPGAGLRLPDSGGSLGLAGAADAAGPAPGGGTVSPWLALLGLARRAGQLRLGEEAARQAVAGPQGPACPALCRCRGDHGPAGARPGGREAAGAHPSGGEGGAGGRPGAGRAGRRRGVRSGVCLRRRRKAGGDRAVLRGGLPGAEGPAGQSAAPEGGHRPARQKVRPPQAVSGAVCARAGLACPLQAIQSKVSSGTAGLQNVCANGKA